ncbi:carboxypeptidase D [Brachionus plicatilis]|uniref:Carboxypeptidase D n=1 Tax=Brachionus plicatilis TaxID=10195 RepID=A0A3M7QNA2_BRAPC|nr:carboxypeptidase D [Brachionus plicatilis]
MFGIYLSFLFITNLIQTKAFSHKYHSHEEITSLLKDLSEKNPNNTYLYSIGKSVKGKDLWVLALADSKPDNHVLLRPEVKYVANIHGNEAVGKEILLKLIDYMLNNQKSDPDVDLIMKTMRVHILPLMNPDGYEQSVMGDCDSVQGRANFAGFDLNRNFPELFRKNGNKIQPETESVLKWMASNRFILSGSFHGGALVANYPYDNYFNSKWFFPKASKTNDDDVFRNLALTYSTNHSKMKKGCDGQAFTDGITNGAKWYPLVGGMQDVNYWRYGCMEITLEVSCCKYPPEKELEMMWNDNKKPMIEFLKMANTGLKGVIKFKNGHIGKFLSIKINSREPIFKTSADGEYFKILLPGDYTISILINCKVMYRIRVAIDESNKFLGVTNFLSEICQQHKDKCHLYSIGKSILGNDLIVISIAHKNPDVHIPLRPEVKYVGCIHGNEFVAQDLLVRLIDYLLTNDSDSDVKYITQNMRVHILPIMNPDGFIISDRNLFPSSLGRRNHAGFDLNRNFPDLFRNISSTVQPETNSVLNWLEENDFVLSANFNGGSLVASYPFDNYLNSEYFPKHKSLTNDNDVFVSLAKTYSFNHSKMRYHSCSEFEKFEDGIINGAVNLNIKYLNLVRPLADWYPIAGGMQDVNYWKYGCMEITLEINCERYPDNSSLPEIWIENKSSMLEFLKKANTGVKGIVKFENGIPASNITIMIDSREPYFKTNANGEYYRLLLPGTYNLSVGIECLSIYQALFSISNNSQLLVLNITSILFLYLVGLSELYKFKYHNHTEVYELLSEYAKNFPNKTHLYSIGKSVLGKDLWVLAIADKDPSTHVPLRPEVKLIANIHGNEVIGKEILLKFINDILYNQTMDPDLDSIMKNMRVHYLPLMNPDGLLKSRENDCSSTTGRYNNAGIDLNRNFPDLFDSSAGNTQPETAAVLDWLERNDFMLSASFHGGSLVANYPFDNYPNSIGYSTKESLTKDNDVFVSLSKVYSFNHLNMRTQRCSSFESFDDGITNGAQWYPIVGGMQDVNYWRYGCMELTLEVSCCKYPSSSTIEKFWEENKNAVIEFLNQANTGVKGIVKFENGMSAGNATIRIDSREPYFKTNKNGEYYRILLPGVYNLSVLFDCGYVYDTQITIPSDSKFLVHNITLSNAFLSSYLSKQSNI